MSLTDLPKVSAPSATWHRYLDPGSADEWDTWLGAFRGFGFEQSYRWANHRLEHGWKPFRWYAVDDEGRVACIAQGLLKALPFSVGMLWIPGGPVGDMTRLDEGFIDRVRQDLSQRFLYVRFFCHKETSDQDARALGRAGWRRVPVKLRSGYSMCLDLAKDTDSLLAAMSRSWRRNLRRFERSGLTVTRWTSPEPREMRDIYDAMEEIKGLETQFTLRELKSLFDQFGHEIALFRCVAADGTTVALRGCLIRGDTAWDLFAAAGAAARDSYATYGLMWRIMRHCKEVGVTHYDLSGIDPNGARGVYDWKRRTGAEELEYLGEWQWTNFSPLSWLANIPVRLKGRGYE